MICISNHIIGYNRQINLYYSLSAHILKIISVTLFFTSQTGYYYYLPISIIMTVKDCPR